jgi:3-phenylpropionate/trans-cinnamate dioxygenase ferredoxin component
MPEFVEVGGVDDLKDGGMKTVMSGNHEVLIARAGDRYFAAENRCPHMGGNLSQGKLNGSIVTCPRHGSQFDLADGHVIRWTSWTGLMNAANRIVKPPRPLKTYDVKIEAGKILIATKEPVTAGPH